MSDDSEKILELCELWIDAAIKNDGELRIGKETVKYRLLKNEIKFHELNYKEMQSACIGLTKVLLHKGLNTVIDYDHLYFWSWTAEVFLYSDIKYFSKENHEIKELFKTIIHSNLAGVTKPTSSKKEWEQQRKKEKLVEFNTKQLIMKKNLITAYLLFPLLEGVLRRKCSQYIDYSGKVKKDFLVPNGYGGSRKYQKTQRCSSLRDLLYLFYNNVSSDNLKHKVSIMREHISTFSDDDAFDLIYNWRNTSLHGESNFPTIGGTLLNLVILIVLDDIKDIYNDIRPKIWEKVKKDFKSYKITDQRSPWSYYPPF